MNESFLSYANTFSAGLFFGIGQFHLLNEGVEKLSKYTKIPLAYFLAAGGYSLILFIQKVVFGYMVSNAEENLGNYSMTSTTRVTLTYNSNSYTINRDNLSFTNYSKNNATMSSIDRNGTFTLAAVGACNAYAFAACAGQREHNVCCQGFELFLNKEGWVGIQ